MNRFSTCGAILASVMLSACATTSFVSTGKAPDAKALQLSGAKVAAVVMISNEAARRAAEDALAREITGAWRPGRGDVHEFKPEARPNNEQAVRAAVEGAGVAGAVVMRPVGKEKEVVATPVAYGADRCTATLTGQEQCRVWEDDLVELGPGVGEDDGLGRSVEILQHQPGVFLARSSCEICRLTAVTTAADASPGARPTRSASPWYGCRTARPPRRNRSRRMARR